MDMVFNMKLTLLLLTACAPAISLSEPTVLVLDKSCVGYSDLESFVRVGGHMWDKFGGRFCVPEETNDFNQVIPVYCDDDLALYPDAGFFVVGEFQPEAFGLGSVHLLDSVVEEWEDSGDETSRECLEHIITHELGHALGLVHTLDNESMMYWLVSASTEPNATDAAQMCSVYPGTAACGLTDGGLWPDVDSVNH